MRSGRWSAYNCDERPFKRSWESVPVLFFSREDILKSQLSLAQKRVFFPRSQQGQHTDFRFSALKTVRNKFLSLTNLVIYGILLQQPELTEIGYFEILFSRIIYQKFLTFYWFKRQPNTKLYYLFDIYENIIISNFQFTMCLPLWLTIYTYYPVEYPQDKWDRCQ